MKRGCEGTLCVSAKCWASSSSSTDWWAGSHLKHAMLQIVALLPPIGCVLSHRDLLSLSARPSPAHRAPDSAAFSCCCCACELAFVSSVRRLLVSLLCCEPFVCDTPGPPRHNKALSSFCTRPTTNPAAESHRCCCSRRSLLSALPYARSPLSVGRLDTLHDNRPSPAPLWCCLST